jgi:hypothetical protein
MIRKYLENIALITAHEDQREETIILLLQIYLMNMPIQFIRKM